MTTGLPPNMTVVIKGVVAARKSASAPHVPYRAHHLSRNTSILLDFSKIFNLDSATGYSSSSPGCHGKLCTE